MRQVTAAVIVESGRLFLAERSAGDRLAGYWELPGGKVEPGETPETCLARELHEELGMLGRVGILLASTRHSYSHGEFELMAYEFVRESDYSLHVHASCVWATRDLLGQLALAPADVSLVRTLRERGIPEV